MLAMRGGFWSIWTAFVATLALAMGPSLTAAQAKLAARHARHAQPRTSPSTKKNSQPTKAPSRNHRSAMEFVAPCAAKPADTPQSLPAPVLLPGSNSLFDARLHHPSEAARHVAAPLLLHRPAYRAHAPPSTR